MVTLYSASHQRKVTSLTDTLQKLKWAGRPLSRQHSRMPSPMDSLSEILEEAAYTLQVSQLT